MYHVKAKFKFLNSLGMGFKHTSIVVYFILSCSCLEGKDQMDLMTLLRAVWCDRGRNSKVFSNKSSISSSKQVFNIY